MPLFKLLLTPNKVRLMHVLSVLRKLKKWPHCKMTLMQATLTGKLLIIPLPMGIHPIEPILYPLLLHVKMVCSYWPFPNLGSLGYFCLKDVWASKSELFSPMTFYKCKCICSFSYMQSILWNLELVSANLKSCEQSLHTLPKSVVYL